jgi:hypothetical protein
MKDWKSFLKGDLLGVHLAVNIFVGTTLLWLLLRLGANTSPIWAISAMVASIDPQVKLAVTMRSLASLGFLRDSCGLAMG